jgi:hypothetical protein
MLVQISFINSRNFFVCADWSEIIHSNLVCYGEISFSGASLELCFINGVGPCTNFVFVFFGAIQEWR